jgi:hypothetical protein
MREAPVSGKRDISLGLDVVNKIRSHAQKFFDDGLRATTGVVIDDDQAVREESLRLLGEQGL